jgi:hypothetical protein
MKPTPLQVFSGYYLGIGLDFSARFFHLNSLAAHFGIGPGELRALLEEYRLDPETVRHVDYNIAKAFATAQEIAIDGQADDVATFAARAFEDFRQAFGSYDPKRDFENVDYDALLPGGSRGDP